MDSGQKILEAIGQRMLIDHVGEHVRVVDDSTGEVIGEGKLTVDYTTERFYVSHGIVEPYMVGSVREYYGMTTIFLDIR